MKTRNNVRSVSIGIIMTLCFSVIGTLDKTYAESLGEQWRRIDDRSEEDAHSVLVDGETTFVAGSGGLIWSSTDRESWVVETAGLSGDLFDLVKGGETLVAVGLDGGIISRTAGGEWAARASGVTANLRTITYGDGIFVAAGDGGTVVRSTNGETWTAWEIETDVRINDLLWDGSKFHAVGWEEFVATAPVNGAWTVHPQIPLTNPLRIFESIQKLDEGYFINAVSYTHLTLPTIYSV